MEYVGLGACVAVGLVLGLLGSGGSMLAVPIFIFMFGEVPKVAIAQSLAVVSVASFVGALTHIANNNVVFRIAVPFGICASAASYVAAKFAMFVPSAAQLGLFATMAGTSSVLMLKSALQDFYIPAATDIELSPLTTVTQATEDEAVESPINTEVQDESADAAVTLADAVALAQTVPQFTVILALQALLVGVLTALDGAGGGFIIVPALTLMAGLEVKAAVGSSLLITTVNSLSGFTGYVGLVPMHWGLVAAAAGLAGGGAVVGTMAGWMVPKGMVKVLYASSVLLLGGVTAVKMVLDNSARQ